MAIADSGATGFYFTSDALLMEVNLIAPSIVGGTTMGQHQIYTAAAKHCIPGLPEKFPMEGHAMPGFAQTLTGIGPICNSGFYVTFLSSDVIVYNKKGTPILSRWCDDTGAKL